MLNQSIGSVMASEVEGVGCTKAAMECSTQAKECSPGIAIEGTLDFVKAYSLGSVGACSFG